MPTLEQLQGVTPVTMHELLEPKMYRREEMWVLFLFDWQMPGVCALHCVDYFLAAGVLTCTLRLLAFVFFYELNGVHSSLGGFLLVALAGCLFESLLSTYDVRGRLRSVVFFILFNSFPGLSSS